MRRMCWRYQGGATETRDGLDIGWWKFLSICLPEESYLPLPNAPGDINRLFSNIAFTGFILTGGDNWGDFPERDETEIQIFNYAILHQLPLLGVCRGAQVLNQLSEGTLKPTAGHVGVRHPVYFKDKGCRVVNSYHNFAIDRLGENLEIIACDANGDVESFRSADGQMAGIMWHPERDAEPHKSDSMLIAQMFNRISN